MRISYHHYRLMLLICTSVLVILALVLILGVIPSVRAEFLRGGTPEKAISGFWVNIGFNLLSAVSIALIALRSKNRNWISTTVSVIIGIIVILMGLALADAASAYIDHGPEMKFASILLFICALVDVLTGILLIIIAILLPKNT